MESRYTLARMASVGSEDEFATNVPEDLEPTGDGSITPDPFLAKVARVPERHDAVAHVARVGDRFGRFEVHGELGRGGMGIVYAARDTTLGREVALKVLPASGDVERRRRFMREARSAAAVTHPGIATVYDVGEQDGAVFIAMERVRGQTLRAWLEKNRPVPIVEAQRIGLAIARTLAKAHEQGVVHRDLKPENAMLTDDGDVKLLDFGLAKLVGPSLSGNGSTTDTQQGRIIGTPCYMSPEQARGLPIDTRSDVFSFGVMFYELVTGERPFMGATSVDLLAAITRDEPRALEEIVPGISTDVARVVTRCLRKVPADRYADARELVRDLDVACANAISSVGRKETISEKNVAQPKAPARLSHKYRNVAAGGLIALGLGAAWWQTSTRMTSSADTMVLPVPTANEAEARTTMVRGLGEFRRGAPYIQLLLRAVDLDPTLAGAHVRIAAGSLFHLNAERSRAHYHKAIEFSAKLDEKDRILLEAIEPLILRQPADWAESIRRFSKAVEKFPNDAHFWVYLAVATANFDDFEKANTHLKQAIQLDPGFAYARTLLAMNTAYEGRFEDAETAAEECLTVVPDSVLCMELISRLRLREGKCEAMANVARRMIAASTSRSLGELVLAESLAARGQPLATVEQAIDQAEKSRIEAAGAVTDSIKKQFAELRWGARMLAGDFETAEARARDLERFTQMSHMQDERGAAAKMLAQVLLEMGRKREAGEVVTNFLDRRDAWEPHPSAEDIAMAKDATPFLLFAAAEAESLSADDRKTRRETWLRDWQIRATPIARSYLWMHAYASTAFSAEESKEALDMSGKFGPIPPFRPETMADAYVGRVNLLAGRTDEAMDWLGNATRSCGTLQFPFEQTRAFLWLGQAKESRGDKQGACGAYQVVLDRWGHAKPKSVSADEARARVSALGCRPT